jgi:GR25 family glycosyltransferase involved in LPS biosynthesis
MKLLFVTPHLSTGGLPQYLLKKIEMLIDTFDIWCIEWDNITGGQLVVQRQKVEGLLGDKLITLHDKEQFIQIVDGINPDVIHFEEFPETFIPSEYLDILYNSKYKICETTHGSLFNNSDKITFPDKMLFVSGLNVKQYFQPNCDFELIEYPSDRSILKKSILKEIALDPNKKHILNVGLFTAGKNQAEIFEMARHFGDDVQFHFVGNQAGNFENYWKPLMNNKPNNCIVWGERNDVWKFYLIADVFLFTSLLENKPLCINEAISYNVPVLMRYLKNYSDIYSDKNVHFLTNDLDKNVGLLKDILGLNYSHNQVKLNTLVSNSLVTDRKYKISSYHMLTDIDSDREIQSMISLSKLSQFDIEYTTCVNKRWTTLPPSENCQYPDKISMEPGGRLTPGHYGCYLAHKGSFYKGIDSESDFILIFECDAVIDVPYEDFIDKLNFACDVLNSTDLIMFSFGYHNNTNIIEKNNDYWVVNKFYGAHAYLIPKRSFSIIDKMYKESKWNVTDLLFAENLDGYKTGIFEYPITKQAAGYSILDKVHHEERY